MTINMMGGTLSSMSKISTKTWNWILNNYLQSFKILKIHLHPWYSLHGHQLIVRRCISLNTLHKVRVLFLTKSITNIQDSIYKTKHALCSIHVRYMNLTIILNQINVMWDLSRNVKQQCTLVLKRVISYYLWNTDNPITSTNILCMPPSRMKTSVNEWLFYVYTV